MAKGTPTPPPAGAPVIVCRGSDCRGGAQQRLCDALDEAGINVVTTGCLGICKGPVVMVPAGERWEIIPRVRGKAARQRLIEAVTGQRRKALKKRAVRGPRRRKAIARGTGRLTRRRHPAFAS